MQGRGPGQCQQPQARNDEEGGHTHTAAGGPDWCIHYPYTGKPDSRLHTLSTRSQVLLCSLSSSGLSIITYISSPYVVEVYAADKPAPTSASGTAGQTGSFLNMAPEVVLNEPYDEKADIFSMGCCFFEVGRFHERSPNQLLGGFVK